ncbi:pilus assembly protein [Nitrospira sp. Kam-Ns4a]
MKLMSARTRKRFITMLVAALAVSLGAVPLAERAWAALAAIDDIATYTATPVFVNQAVPPNILFIMDFSDAMLPAAYGTYPISYCTSSGNNPPCAAGSPFSSNYSSNYKGSGLTVTTPLTGSSTATPLGDLFDATKQYFGMFDPFACYADPPGTNGFARNASLQKTNLNDSCQGSWDGNFLNWLTMRKVDLAKKVLIGGRTISASNQDGTANYLISEPKIGQNGSTNDCSSTSKPCWRYVKFVPLTLLVGRVPATYSGGAWTDTAWQAAGSEAPGTISSSGTNVTGSGTSFTKQFKVGDSLVANGQTRTVSSIASDTSLTVSSAFPTNLAAGTAYYAPGIYFGEGGGSNTGTLYINNDGTANPFDNQPTTFPVEVDLSAESASYKQSMTLGLMQNLTTSANGNMRVAVMFTNSSATGSTGGIAGTVQNPFDDPSAVLNGNGYSSTVTNVRNQAVQSLAPLAEATYEALCYYRQVSGPCFNSQDWKQTILAQNDPFWFCARNSDGTVGSCSPPAAKMVSCCKSFILMVSSGQPSSDQNNTPSPSPFTYDGTSNNLVTGGTDQYGLRTTRLDDVAWYGRTHDVRPDTGTGAVPGKQSVTFYAVNAMGGAAGAQVLASAAKYGGFTDQNGNGVPDAGTQTCTYPAGSNLGSGSSVSSPEWDANADCIPDTYFDASQGADLEGAIKKAIDDILKNAASGTSVSVLAASGTGEGAVYQAYFFPREFQNVQEIKWTGYTQSLFLDAFGNLREDTDQDHSLSLTADYIVRTRYDTSSNSVVVDRFQDTNGDGVADVQVQPSVGLKDVKAIWEAGKKLATTPSSSRRIFTWVDNGDGIINDGTFGSGTVGSSEVILFNQANLSTLSPYLRGGVDSSQPALTATNIISFILGDNVANLRNRLLSVPGSGCNVDPSNADLCVWKYGDPADSTPTVVGAPKERYDVIYGDASYNTFYRTYKTRRQVVYVGANDGMLHAFNAGFYHRGDGVTTHGQFTTAPGSDLTAYGPGPLRSGNPDLGRELWGFIPFQLLPHLRWLAETGYTHVYYVDLKPKVTDVRIFNDDADHPGGWGTILIGGMRLGGSCKNCTAGQATPMTFTVNSKTMTFYSAYFILDITNPEKDPVLLWSFTADGLGLTTAYPTVVRVNSKAAGIGKTDNNASQNWYVVFGSGPTDYNGGSAQTGTFYVMNLKTGAVTTFATATSVTKSFMGDVISVDADLDYRADLIYAGSVFDNSPNSPAWIGKLYRLTTNQGDISLSNWGNSRVPSVLLGTFPAGGTTPVGPITAAPTAAADDSNHLWVYFGTGRYFSTADKSNLDIQYFFGVKDPCTTDISATCQGAQRNNLLNVSTATICSVCATAGQNVSGVTNPATGTPITTFDGAGSTTTLQGLVGSMDGWVTDLLPTDTRLAQGERVLSAPTIIGGIVFFTTFIPNTDICSASGNGNLYALFYLTGTAYKESVVGTQASGSITKVLRSISLGQGLPSQVQVHLGDQGTGSLGQAGSGANPSGCTGRLYGLVQASNGVTNQFCGKSAATAWSRYLSWISQRD